MFTSNRFVILALVAASSLLPARSAQAGPLLDWILGKRQNTTTALPVAGCPTPGACTMTCQQTCQRVAVNYVPHTEYRAQWTQVPVTTYRPQTTVDPVAGCQITCMKPCTTYEWRVQSTPYTTYRPVYSTYTVQMPATTSYYSGATATTSGCSTCGIPAASSTVLPGTTTLPSSTVPSTTWGGQSVGVPGSSVIIGSPGVPADTRPTLTPGAFTPMGIPSNQTVQPGTTQRIVVPQEPAPTSILRTEPTPAFETPTPIPAQPEAAGASFTAPAPKQADPPNTKIQPIVDPKPELRAEPGQAPALLDSAEANKMTSVDPSRRPWNYTPVKFAVYTESQNMAASSPAQSEIKQATLIVPSSEATLRLEPIPMQPASAPASAWKSLGK